MQQRHSFVFVKQNSTYQGFTLLEIVIAFSIVLFAFGTIFTLSLSMFKAVNENQNAVIAENLAKEGIEFVRILREETAKNCEKPCNNWKTFLTNGSFPLPNHSYRVGRDIFESKKIFIEEIGNEENATLVLCQEGETFAYTLEKVCHGQKEKTNFSRIIFFPETESSDIENANDFLKVRVEVTWKESENQKNVTLEENLYNWLP